MTREQFIDRHSSLFWYTPESEKHNVSDELLVETTLNEGTMDDYRQLRDIMTPPKLAKVFFSAIGRRKCNYYPEIRHFFSLILKAYA